MLGMDSEHLSTAASAAILVTAIGCGISGGVFFAFSSFVMEALRRLPAAQAIAAMQSINRIAVTPVFMTALFAPALACAGLAVAAVADWDARTSALVLAASALYVGGTIAMTAAYHVPRNNDLDALAPDAPGAGEHWRRYDREWSAANHMRTVTAIAAATLLTLALHA